MQKINKSLNNNQFYMHVISVTSLSDNTCYNVINDFPCM